MTFDKQLTLNPQQRARRILAAWNRCNLSELRSVLEESPYEVRDAHRQEQAELLETVTGTIRAWLQSPEELPQGELQASLSLLHHLTQSVQVSASKHLFS